MLWEFTGKPVIGVFQTLSAGNAGQFVPGIVILRGAPAAPASGVSGAILSASALSATAIRARRRTSVDASRGETLTRGAYHHQFRTRDNSGHNRAVSEHLKRPFFARDPVSVARGLIGCVMVVSHDQTSLHARITETEAYAGEDDPASHAYRGSTPRTAIMFGPAGFVYVYKSYGIHWCMNIVTGPTGAASAVLLRAASATDADSRLERMGGPGLLTRALGITGEDNGQDVCSSPPGRIFFQPRAPTRVRIGVSTRVGITKAIERPWRFFLE